jgi:hypothetical protein
MEEAALSSGYRADASRSGSIAALQFGLSRRCLSLGLDRGPEFGLSRRCLSLGLDRGPSIGLDAAGACPLARVRLGLEELPLARQAVGVAVERSVGADHSVARNHNRDRILGAGRAHCPSRAGRSHGRGDLPV